MRYYLIAGEASGDLHASRLMKSIKDCDPDADFRFFGGDCMSEVGGARVKHYKELAYMGFIPVLMHLPTIFRNMSLCKHDIISYKPDVVILIDYPGFNLSIAEFVHKHTDIPVYYYISPKIWAWKEYRIKSIKRYVDEMFSILPFEVDFYEGKHNFHIHYVGNPTAEEIADFKANYTESETNFKRRNSLDNRPIIALLAGSRRQEIKDNLPTMIDAAKQTVNNNYQLVVAGAPGISESYYKEFITGTDTSIIFGETYKLLTHSRAAVVTSGTATLETALLNVPQVVCYKTPMGKLIAFLKRHILNVEYISLVNLIDGSEVVKELVADTFSKENIAKELSIIIPDGEQRSNILNGYERIRNILGSKRAAENAANIIVKKLQ